MPLHGIKKGRSLSTLFLVLGLCFGSGCATVGPQSISAGRADYNEAINRTEDEQILLSIVKERYGETSSLLAVNSVAANVRFRADAGAEVGIGPLSGYERNLVPFKAGLAYEENPTISYSPVQGEKYIQSLLSPIALDFVLMTLRSSVHGDKALILFVDRINCLRNPDFLTGPAANPNARFTRFVDLYAQLRRAGVLDLVSNPQKDSKYAVLVSDYRPQYVKKVSELISLLDLPASATSAKDIVIPVRLSVQTGTMNRPGFSGGSFMLVRPPWPGPVCLDKSASLPAGAWYRLTRDSGLTGKKRWDTMLKI